MAIQNINFNPKPEKGVSYSAITDSSVDWTGITNSTYFYDKATDLPYYKNASGTVISLFEEGGGGGNTLYSADDTIGSGRIATLTDTLTYKGIGTSLGQRNIIIRDGNNDYILENFDNGYFKRTIRSGSNLGVISNAGLTQGLWLQTVSELAGAGGLLIKNAKADVNYLKYFTDNFKAPDAQWYSNGAIHHRIRSNGTSSTVLSQVSFFIEGFYGFGFNVGASAPIGAEDISLQGETVIKGDDTLSTSTALAIYDGDTTPSKIFDIRNDGSLIQKGNTTATADASLLNNSFSFHIDSGELKGRYKNNLGVVTDLTIGEKPTLSKTFTLDAPTASDDVTIFRTDVAITVQEVIAVSVGTSPSTTYQLKHSTDRNTALSNDLTTSSTTTSRTTGNVATLSDATIPADSWIWFESTAASGTDVVLTIDIRYTED